MSVAWSFEEARQACRAASSAQAQAENAMRAAARDAAVKDEQYRVALAKEIVRQHADEGVSWSTAPDLARGNELVARLRRDRDIAEGVREALVQAAWRAAADRKDAQRFSDWSMRQQLADGSIGDDKRLAWSGAA
jgi:hypothetical protein